MKENKIIFAHAADPGDAAVVLPVVKMLREQGHEVVLIARKVAAQKCKEGGMKFVVYDEEDADYFLKAYGEPDLLITGMCSTDFISRDLIRKLKGKCPTVAQQDFWGAQMASTWKPIEFRPDAICVNDEVGAEIVLRAWPEYAENKIQVLGYPSLDVYHDFEVDQVALKESHNMTEDLPVIMFAGQLATSGETFLEVVKAIESVGEPVYLLPRQHPRWNDDAPEIDKQKWTEAEKVFSCGHVVFTSGPNCEKDKVVRNIDELIMVSDITLSLFSTVLVNAAVLRKPNISVLFPHLGMKRYLEEHGTLVDDFPLVDLECTAKAETPAELSQYIQAGIKGELDFTEAQERSFVVDGQNTRRVTDFLLSIM